MKRILLIISLFSNILLSAQRYFPGLRSIFMEKGSYKALPKEDFNYFIEWGQKNVENFFMKDLQHSGGDDSSFNSLGLVTKNEMSLDLVDTGFVFKVSKDPKSDYAVTNVLATDTWKARRFGFELGDFGPSKKLDFFLNIRRFLNITKEQSLAHFINIYPKPKTDNVSNTKQFILDVNAMYKSDFPASFADDGSKTLKDLLSAMNKHFKSDDANVLAFYTYIDPNNEADIKTVYDNIANYYKGLNGSSLDGIVNNYFMPKGSYEFTDQNVSLFLPDNLFYKTKMNDKSNVNFKVREVQHQLEYDIIKNKYTFYIKIIPYSGTLSSDFRFVSRFDDVLLGKNKVSELSVPQKNLKDITLILTKENISVSVDYLYNDFDIKRNLKNPIKTIKK